MRPASWTRQAESFFSRLRRWEYGVSHGVRPAYLADYLSMLRARGVLLVRASRTGAGPVIRNANADDDAQGWVVTDDQNPPRARLLAALALAHHDSPEALQQVFWRY